MSKSEQHNRLYTRMWRDPAFRALSERGRNVARYMLTGPHRLSEGIYYVTPAMIADDIGCTVAEACEAIREGTESGIYRYSFDSAIALLPKALRYQRCTNNKHAKGVADRIANLHDRSFVPALYGAAVEYGDTFLVAALEALELPELVATKPIAKDSDSPTEDLSEDSESPSEPYTTRQRGSYAPCGDNPFGKNTLVVGERGFSEDQEPFGGAA